MQKTLELCGNGVQCLIAILYQSQDVFVSERDCTGKMKGGIGCNLSILGVDPLNFVSRKVYKIQPIREVFGETRTTNQKPRNFEILARYH